MAKYEVHVVNTRSYFKTIEAEDEEDAKDKAYDLAKKEGFDSFSFDSQEIEVDSADLAEVCDNCRSNGPKQCETHK